MRRVEALLDWPIMIHAADPCDKTFGTHTRHQINWTSVTSKDLDFLFLFFFFLKDDKAIALIKADLKML